jgi:hypothetical protein
MRSMAGSSATFGALGRSLSPTRDVVSQPCCLVRQRPKHSKRVSEVAYHRSQFGVDRSISGLRSSLPHWRCRQPITMPLRRLNTLHSRVPTMRTYDRVAVVRIIGRQDWNDRPCATADRTKASWPGTAAIRCGRHAGGQGEPLPHDALQQEAGRLLILRPMLADVLNPAAYRAGSAR